MTFRDRVKAYTAARELEEMLNPKKKWISIYQSSNGDLFLRHEETEGTKYLNDDDVEIYRVVKVNERKKS